MTKEETITRLCQITSLIGATENNVWAADCFCGAYRGSLDFRFDASIFDILEKAVVRELHKRHPEISKADIRAELARRTSS